ncbi:MAG: hypothetical protein SGI77_16915 [Pirellulaceae bacterium]|nr:hypothetical protein [Pirellulaceae bacterium]
MSLFEYRESPKVCFVKTELPFKNSVQIMVAADVGIDAPLRESNRTMTNRHVL